MLDDFPLVILMDIFARLPVKTLLQFMCVCKSWYAIIKDPIFITNHVKHQSALSNNGYLAVTRRVGTFGGTCFISLRSYETNFGEILKINIPSPKEYRKAPFRIVDSCNGVLCLTVTKDTNFLFNPATSEFKELPKPDYPTEDIIGLGFGHDLESNDYKLVRFSFSEKLGDDFYSGVDVYSLSSNSWRRKDKRVLGSVTRDSFSKGLINGNLHWRGAIGFAESGEKRLIREIIISFCIRNEVCKHIKLPEIEIEEDDWYPFVRKESLAIVIGSGRIPTFTIWVMKEYGVQETWTKLLTVGPLYARRLVGCGRNEELLFASSSTMYHLRGVEPPCQITLANFMGKDFVPQVEVVNHIESLVPIEGTKVRVKRELKKSCFRENFIFICVILIAMVPIFFRKRS
jgi:F-box interacting protein